MSTSLGEASQGMAVTANMETKQGVKPMRSKRSTRYEVECFREGVLIWTDHIDNLVVNEGLDDSLNKYFKGASYTATHFVGITGSAPVASATNTMASATRSWSEVTAYASAKRPTLTMASAASQSVTNSASKAVFTINANNTVIGGAFTVAGVIASAVGGVVGILYGVGAFAGGNKELSINDVLNVTLTATASAQ